MRSRSCSAIARASTRAFAAFADSLDWTGRRSTESKHLARLDELGEQRVRASELERRDRRRRERMRRLEARERHLELAAVTELEALDVEPARRLDVGGVRLGGSDARDRQRQRRRCAVARRLLDRVVIARTRARRRARREAASSYVDARSSRDGGRASCGRRRRAGAGAGPSHGHRSAQRRCRRPPER